MKIGRRPALTPGGAGGRTPGHLTGITDPNRLVGTLKYHERVHNTKALLLRAFDLHENREDRLCLINPLVGALADKNAHCSAACSELLGEMMLKDPKVVSSSLRGALGNPERAVPAERIFLSSALMSPQIAYEISCSLTICLGDEKEPVVRRIYKKIMSQDLIIGGDRFTESVVKPVVGALGDLEAPKMSSAAGILREAAEINFYRTAATLTNALDDPRRKALAKGLLLEISPISPYEISKVMIAASSDPGLEAETFDVLRNISDHSMHDVVSALLHLAERTDLADITRKFGILLAEHMREKTVKALLSNIMSGRMRPYVQAHLLEICNAIPDAREYILSELQKLSEK